ncbi:cupin domain-containing protein [Chromobacterium vaccinii]|uniref:cupin domain-containing protein n=1 Tax=Chromobacterium vaccinii TaxID=1108595 RepID=UPI000E1B2C93|nr:cupin domain-containing protein [Chromobacterium vaccinii]SUX29509.1 Cupin [Chromobacterium vaccinii]
MDLLEDIFAAMRVESALYARLEARAPWGIDFAHQVSARFGIVAHGRCLLDGAGLDQPLPLAAGDLFIVSGGQRFRLMDEAGREAPPCETVFAGRCDGVIRFGGDGEETGIVSGRFVFDAAAGAPLMDLLPPVLHLRLDAERARLLRAALEMIARENAAPALGSRLVVQKLVDVLLIEALRIHCLSGQGDGWLGRWPTAGCRRYCRPSTPTWPRRGRWRAWRRAPACRARPSPAISAPEWAIRR